MPKATKLHSKPKGKPNSIQKSCKVDKDNTDAADSEDSLSQFQLELCWCIQQLERTLSDKKGNEKQLQEAWKILTVLKNNNQPMIRKRQLMRTHFGDYRAKMAAEEKKLAKMASKMKITESPAQPKATFLRKSAFLTTGDSSFRFNFNLNGEQLETVPENAPEASNNSMKPQAANNNVSDSNAKGTTPSDDEKSNKAGHTDCSKFKFTFSNTGFKFNFDVNDKP